MRIYPTHRLHVQTDMFQPTAIQRRFADLNCERAPPRKPDTELQREEKRIKDLYERSRTKIRRDFKQIIDTYAPESIDKPAKPD